ncbi:MAG: PfkB family carbohydrate kinase [Chitinophagaceae bacterium]
MNEQKLKQILQDIRKLKIAVIGDFCLDVYWFIDASHHELSVETGKAIQPVYRQKYSLGGAGNLVNNLVALGVQQVEVMGVVGNDPFGAEMLQLFQKNKVNTDAMFVQGHNWNTNVYIKPHLDVEEQSRIDFGRDNLIDPEIVTQVIDKLYQRLPELDVVIINQQVAPGFHSQGMRKLISECIQKHPDKLFIADSRDFSGEFQGALLKLNDREAARLCGVNRMADEYLPYEEVRSYCTKIFNRWHQPVFVTRRERGLFVQDRSGFYQIPGLHTMGEVDTVGAGDSMIAGIATVLACGHEPKDAGTFGNFVAGITVQKLFQTGTASPEEILQIGADPDYVYEPELAEDSRRAMYYHQSEIEIINTWPSELSFTHAIFDHDGTVSTLREGWEQVMQPMMMEAIFGDSYEKADLPVIEKVERRVAAYIDKTTGIQTIAQMTGLVGLIREFGFVPAEQIKSAKEYKAIYNEAILRLVNKRLKKFHDKELSIQDFTIKHAIPFLETLYRAGIPLYLASGTDEQDVINEATELGYAHLFEDRIYGSVGDIKKDAKKMVLDRILNDIGEQNFTRVVTFGDGPVEIRETRKRGGLTVGIASDEIRRYGIDMKKRTRLVKAGADVIIPDFSQLSLLLDLMQVKQTRHAVSAV